MMVIFKLGYLVVIFTSLVALCLQYSLERFMRDTSLPLYDMLNLMAMMLLVIRIIIAYVIKGLFYSSIHTS